MAAIKRLGINADLQHRRQIRYTSRDYVDIKNDLNAYLVQIFPEISASDFTENSGTQVFVELIAYVSDQMNFYLDKQFNELIIDRAVEKDNVYSLSKGLGYQPAPIRPAVADIDFTFNVPVTGSLSSQYFFTLGTGTQFSTQSGNSVFENLTPIIFNAQTAPNFNSVITTDSMGINVTQFSLSGVKIISGITDQFKVSITNAQSIRNVHVPYTPINSILNVIDSDGYDWYEVKNLAQEFIFTGVPNFNSDLTDVPYNLIVKRVPRRYVVTYNSDGSADLTFGSGEIDLTDTEQIINPENVVYPNKTIGKFLDYNPDSIKLEDFLNTTSLGVAPSNVTLYVNCRIGGGIKDNVGPGQITVVGKKSLQFYSLSLNIIERNYVGKSIVVSNPEAAQGGEQAESLTQIRNNASYWYAAQDRVVTVQDYIARLSTIPIQYGSVYKVVAHSQQNQTFDMISQVTDYIEQLVNQRASGTSDEVLKNQIINLNQSIKDSASDIKLYVICRDVNGYLSKSTGTLRKNIITYMNFFKPVSETLEIDDLNVLNIGCRFMIHVDTSSYKPSEVQLNVMNLIMAYLNTSRMEVGQGINKDDLRAAIMTQVSGVISIPELEFFIISGVQDGRQYSNDFPNATIDQFNNYNKTIVQIDGTTILECKYPAQDIIGRFAD